MARRVVHYRDLRLYVNAGVVYPVCKAERASRVGAIDIGYVHNATRDKDAVTCRNCPPAFARLYPWAGAKGFTHPRKPSRGKFLGLIEPSAKPATHQAAEAPRKSRG